MHRVRYWFWCLAFTACYSACSGGELALAQHDGLTVLSIEAALKPLIEKHAGTVSIAVRILGEDDQTLVTWGHRGEAVMPTASLIKLPVMIEAYRQADEGSIALDKLVELQDKDKVPGSGILTEHFSAGLQLPIRDAIRLMIRYSDNTATNLVIDQIGLGSTTRAMKELGRDGTQLHAKVFRSDTSIDRLRSERYGLGSSTALDMVELLTELERGKIVSESASYEMLGHLLACDDVGKLNRFLPSAVKVACKTGAVTRVRTAAGIIYLPTSKIVVAVLTEKNADTRWSSDNSAELLSANVAKTIYDLASASSAEGKLDPKQLGQGSTGALVEALQRTLNARAATDLSVDGDFGPATEAAVKKFQSASGLPETGMVDAATWQKLGTLIAEEANVDPPEVVNSRELSQVAQLDPNGPPEVSAKAWAILDASSGAIIESQLGESELPNASTTKIMTAYLVLEIASKKPEVLNEIVTFSERADNTGGSTAGVRAGEQLSVHELLFGLLLPSGNDASIAVAEHFGERLAATPLTESHDRGPAVAYELFVAAMNRKALELGMPHTHFVNTHGLTEAGHHSSAIDLGRLAVAARNLPGFNEYVNTRERGCRLVSVDGYRRDVVWKNTNQLLAQEGFEGMKTGTTSAAGACLVAVGHHRHSERIVVILGSSSSAARYIDARNLFSWAWRQ